MPQAHNDSGPIPHLLISSDRMRRRCRQARSVPAPATFQPQILMRDIFRRLTPDERRAINQLRLRVILFYALLIGALVVFTSIKAMWGENGDVMEAQATGTGIHTTAARPSGR